VSSAVFAVLLDLHLFIWIILMINFIDISKEESILDI
jgi:hypothetical protein